MKVCIKSFFLSVLMSLVTLVSCVQEANDGSQRLDGTVADLSGQVASVSSSLEQLNALQNVVEQDLSELSADLETHIGYLKSGVSRMDGTMATLQLQKEVAMVVAELQAAGFESSMTQFVKSVKSWLGKSFETYFDVLVYGCASQALVEGAALQLSEQHGYIDAVLSDVEAGLRDGVPAEELASVLETLAKNLASATELTSKVDEIVLDLETECAMAVEALFDESSSYDANALKKAATQARIQLKSAGESFNTLTASVNALTTRIGEIENKLSAIETAVDELLGMIQSVTFMSEYTDEYAYALYNMDLNTKIDDSNLSYNGKALRTAAGTMNLTYMVRPAAAVKALNANNEAVDVIGYYAKSAVATRAPLASDYIDFEITKIEVINEDRGLVTVTVKPELREAFYYKEIGAKCAISIKSGKTDVVSKFVEILPKENSTRVYVQSVVPSKQVINMKKGTSAQLTATVNPEGVSSPGYRLNSPDTHVIRLNEETGEIYAYGVGTATITVTSKGTDEWGVPVTAKCTVEVEEAFMLSGPTSVEQGYEAKIFLSHPSDVPVKTVEWGTSDDTKLSISSEDIDGAKVKGEWHTYNATTKQYTDVTVYCTVNGSTTVYWNMSVAAIQPEEIITPVLEGKEEISMRIDESLSLASTISPINVPEGAYKIRYQSDQGGGWINYDTGVINEYKVTLSPTIAWVTITVANNDQHKYLIGGEITKSVIVRVLPYYVQSISFDDVELNMGQSVTLSPRFTADVDGKVPTNTTVTWKSENENVATVDENGVVTPIAPGEVNIIATATDGSNVSGTCSISIIEQWKEFEVGHYVVRKNLTKEIEFYSDLQAAKNAGYVAGVVIAKTNPRATDVKLPENCIHGIAVALGEKSGKWWNDSPGVKIMDWAIENGYVSTEGSNGSQRTGSAGLYVGYNNTSAMRDFIKVYSSVTSEILQAVNSYENNNGRPNGTSEFYIPSVAEMDAIAANVTLLNQRMQNCGTSFTNQQYWTSSDCSGSSSWAVAVNPMTGAFAGNKGKTNSLSVRFVFAF